MKNGGNAVSLTAKTDYYPFGMPMPNRNIEGNYRYKFQGQEKDAETGKEAFELRLWDGRIGRWLTTDPAGQYSSPYLGMGNNPIYYIDKAGDTIRPASEKDRNRVESLKTRIKQKKETYFNLLENSDIDILVSYDEHLTTYVHSGKKYTTYGATEPDFYSDPNYSIKPNDVVNLGGEYGVVGALNFELKSMNRAYPIFVKDRRITTIQEAKKFWKEKAKYELRRVHVKMNSGIESTPNIELETGFHELGHVEYYIKNPFEGWIWMLISQRSLERGLGHDKLNPNGNNADLRESQCECD